MSCRSSTDDGNRDTSMHIMQKKKMTMSMSSWSSSSTCLFSLTEDLMVEEILLKLPVDSLLRLRCVSKYFHRLITSPSFVRNHLHLSSTAQFNNNILISSCFGLLPDEDDPESVTSKMIFVHSAYSNFSTTSGDDDDCPSRPDVLRMHCPFDSVGIQASCNGLLFFHGTMMHNYITTPPSYLWNPCTKEYRELLPPSPPIGDYLFEGIPESCCTSSGFCGFGYDRTNDEYKILYHENRVCERSYYDDDDDDDVGFEVEDDDDDVGFEVEDDHDDDDDLISITEFKLYNLGTNTWRRISNPYRSLFFGQLLLGLTQKIRTGLLANGALHWLMSSSPSSSNHATNAKIISFDMEKEEFGEVEKPQYSTVEEEKGKEYCYGALQVLKGCLCLPQYSFHDFSKVDILMLKDCWTKLFTIVVSDRLFWRSLKLLTFCENGEIIMYRGCDDLISYNPVNQKARRVEKLESLYTDWTNEVSYIETLVSLNSGTYIRPTEGNQLPNCSQIVWEEFTL